MHRLAKILAMLALCATLWAVTSSCWAQSLSVAVLEFDEMDSPARPTGLGRVVAEEFMYALDASPGFNLISMDRVFEAQARLRVQPGSRCQAARKIGLATGSDAVLCGAVTRSGNQALIDAYLLDTATGRTLWSKSGYAQMDQAGFMDAARRYLTDMAASVPGPTQELAQAEPDPEPEVVEPEPEPEVVEPDPEPEPEVVEPEPDQAVVGQETNPDPNADPDALAEQDPDQDVALAEPDSGYESEPFPRNLDDQRRQEQERMDRERALLEFEIPSMDEPAVTQPQGPLAQADSRQVIAQSEHAARAEAMLQDLEQRINDRLATMERGSDAAEAAYDEAGTRYRRLLEAERERLYGLLRERYNDVADRFAADNGYAAVVEPDEAESAQGEAPDVSDQLLQALNQARVTLPESMPLELESGQGSDPDPEPGHGDIQL